MPQQIVSRDGTAPLRMFLALVVAWSMVEAALVLAVYQFHLSAWTAYLLALIPSIPALMIAAVAWRRSSLEPNADLRRYYRGAVIFGVVLLLLTVGLVLFTLSFVSGLEFAMLVAALPLVCGIVPAASLIMPNHMAGGLSISPIRARLATPTIRRMTLLAVLYIIYNTLDFASKSLFDGNHPPTGLYAHAIALLPVLPLFGLIPIYNRYMSEERDEFQRQLFHQSVLWAFLGTFVIASVMGRLQDHNLIGRGPESFRPYSIFPVFWWLQLETMFAVNLIQALRMRAQEKQEKAAR